MKNIEIFDFQHIPPYTHETSNIVSFFSNKYHYKPQNFGRSTLRKADFLIQAKDYSCKIERHQMILFWTQQATDIILGDSEYNIPALDIASYLVPAETTLSILAAQKIWIFACDIKHVIDKVTLYNSTSEINLETFIQHHTVNGEHVINPQEKPFYGHILDGEVEIDNRIISKNSGFYIEKRKFLVAPKPSKIITFEMPIPL